MGVEPFDHTGDIGVRLSAGSCDELFGEAAVALTDIITDITTVEERQIAQIGLSSPELALLLREWLSELLFRFDAQGWLTRRAEVAIDARGTPLTLDARLYGE
ncbi:MAG: archease, partial [Acidobacteria bacterium]|nr:archease [Acidobacteriota bacterium]